MLSFQPLAINVTNKIARSCLASHPSQFKLMERTALSLPLLAASYHGQQAECNRCLRHHRRQSRNFRRLRTCTCAPWVLQAEIGCGSSHLFYRVPGACTSAFCLLPRPTHGQHPVGRRRLQALAGHAGFAHLAPAAAVARSAHPACILAFAFAYSDRPTGVHGAHGSRIFRMLYYGIVFQSD